MKASRLLSFSMAALLPAMAAMAQTPPTAADPQPPQQQQGATFEQLDTNGDDKISKEEAAANDSVSAQFSRYDQDGNGFIERAEVASTNHPSEPQQ